MDILAIRQKMSDSKTKLNEALNHHQEQSYKDERFWTLDYDKNTKSGKAIIRPIGPANGESDEYVTEYTHFLRRNNKILSIKCPTTSKHKCPICEHYFSKSKDEREAQFARMSKHIMNILVVKDFNHPENNGKVFLWKCPVSVMQKIAKALKETDEMDMPKESINVFDMWEGANINLVTCDKSGWLNYDSTTIAPKSPIFEDTENTALYEDLYKKLYPLSEFKETPTTEEVQEKFNDFMELVDTNKFENSLRSEQKKVFESVDEIDSLPDEASEPQSSSESDAKDDIWDEI